MTKSNKTKEFVIVMLKINGTKSYKSPFEGLCGDDVWDDVLKSVKSHIFIGTLLVCKSTRRDHVIKAFCLRLLVWSCYRTEK